MFEESVRSPSTSSLSSWNPLTLPSELSPSTRAAVIKVLPSGSPSVLLGETGHSASADGVQPHAHQDFPFPDASCVSGMFESDPRVFDFAINPMQKGFWLPPQQAWTSGSPTQLARDAASPTIRGDSDQVSSNVDGPRADHFGCHDGSDIYYDVSDPSLLLPVPDGS